jgi:hypothetical protein
MVIWVITSICLPSILAGLLMGATKNIPRPLICAPVSALLAISAIDTILHLNETSGVIHWTSYVLFVVLSLVGALLCRPWFSRPKVAYEKGDEGGVNS